MTTFISPVSDPLHSSVWPTATNIGVFLSVSDLDELYTAAAVMTGPWTIF
ncbi:hypothetical protein ACWEWG_00445 [Streptomyces sp. NPDC003758]|uniref:Uncharacterized protein n=1 Tax=Streptomyces cynarae TaxID=2981134 RepID=A0ABY6DVE8_9ACTN|nr:hypothetical protein [Streptomyces cynarae]UXY17693.1 hypothetical protein N8I84_02215 [Streptomyces cynarae]